MQTVPDTQLIQFEGRTLRIRESTLQPPRLLLLIHGLTGDENVMWVFARDLAAHYWMVAPRHRVLTMTRDLRKYARQTNIRLGVGAVLVLLIVGLGLIYFIYGPGAAVRSALPFGWPFTRCFDHTISRNFGLDTKTCKPLLTLN